ncbi:MAG: hypothetical protein V7704_08440 [Aurantimonas endophytica]
MFVLAMIGSRTLPEHCADHAAEYRLNQSPKPTIINLSSMCA